MACIIRTRADQSRILLKMSADSAAAAAAAVVVVDCLDSGKASSHCQTLATGVQQATKG